MKKLLIFHMILLGILGFLMARSALAATAIVPNDHATIQAAVTAVQNDSDPGIVIINSDATFDESIQINESVTIRAGSGFAPVIERNSGSLAPIRIRTLQDVNTMVVLQDIEVRTPASSSSNGISISNVSTSHNLSVTIDNVFVDAVESQNAVSVASASINANINLTIVDSYIQIVGAAAGNPHCLRLDPYAYNIFCVLRNNTLRFSRAGGISIEGGRDDKLVTALIDANVFEGFASAGGDGRTGVCIYGTGGPGTSASPTVTYVSNNLFLNTQGGIDVNGQMEHTHTLYANNNTIINSQYSGLSLEAFSISVVTASVSNNIIVGSGDFGIYRQNPATGTINLTNKFNLLFDNAAGNYSGAAAGADSLATDPMFTNPAADNYRLQPASVAIDWGTNTPSGGLGFGFDLDGNTRIQDDDGDGSAVINLGAYEEPQAAPSPPSTPSMPSGGGGGGGGCFISAAANAD